MTSRRLALFLFPLTALAALSGCSNARPVWPEKGLRVVVSFAPLDSFAKKVVGDHGTVQCLCVGQNGVHDFEPSPEDAVLLHRADVLFANGLGLDDAFTEKLRINCGNPKLRYVKVGELIPEAERLKMHGSDETDPHVWLGVTQAMSMVNAIRDQLKEADPDNAKDYEANAANYVKDPDAKDSDGKDLNSLLKYGHEALSKIKEKDRKILSFHESLSYFAKDFSIDVKGYIQLEPGVDPSAARYAEMVSLCEKEGVRVIAVEPQYSQAAADRLKEELNKRGVKDVEVVTVDPLESATAEELKDPDLYTKKMRENIDALVKAFPK